MNLLPIGARVTILRGAIAPNREGTIAGHVTYRNDHMAGRMEPGYAVQLDTGGFLNGDTADCWVGMIVCHVESVEHDCVQADGNGACPDCGAHPAWVDAFRD